MTVNAVHLMRQVFGKEDFDKWLKCELQEEDNNTMGCETEKQTQTEC